MTIATAIPTGPAAYPGADVLAESLEGVSAGTGAIGSTSGPRGVEGESHLSTSCVSGQQLGRNFQASWSSAIESLIAAAHESARSRGDGKIMARSVDPGQQRIAESGNVSGAAATKRDAPESAPGMMKDQFDVRGDSTHGTNSSAHQGVHAKSPRVADGRQKHLDSNEEFGGATPDHKTATGVQLNAIAHFGVQLPVSAVTRSDNSRSARSASSPSTVATDVITEMRTTGSAALPAASRTNAFNGAGAGVSINPVDESATRMAASDEFVAAGSNGVQDQGASKVIDLRSLLGWELDQATPPLNETSPADIPRVVYPPPPRLPSVDVIQSAQWSGHAAMKDAPGQLLSSRTIRNTTRVGASTGFASEQRSLGLAAPEGISSVQLRDLAAGNGSGQPLATGVGITHGPVHDTNGRVVEDPFAVIDTDRSSGATTWIHAGLRHAEAGFLDPALGWVGVRADASGSGIHAAVVPGSPEAAQALGGHISGLSAYIAEHHGHSATVTLASPPGRSDGTGGDPQPGFGNPGAGRHSAGSHREGDRGTRAVEPPQERSANLVEPVSGAITIGGQGSDRSGTYVSVVA